MIRKYFTSPFARFRFILTPPVDFFRIPILIAVDWAAFLVDIRDDSAEL